MFPGRFCIGSARAIGKNRAEQATTDALDLIRPIVGEFVNTTCIHAHVSCPDDISLEESVIISNKLQGVLGRKFRGVCQYYKE
jgi:hypothetical protein